MIAGQKRRIKGNEEKILGGSFPIYPVSSDGTWISAVYRAFCSLPVHIVSGSELRFSMKHNFRFCPDRVPQRESTPANSYTPARCATPREIMAGILAQRYARLPTKERWQLVIRF